MTSVLPLDLTAAVVSVLAAQVLEGAIQTSLFCRRPDSNTVRGGLCVFMALSLPLSEARVERAGGKQEESDRKQS